jgi:hypothetical protein
MNSTVSTHSETVALNFGKWLMVYGIFLFAVGLVGYLSNPEAAKTALISGGVFGTLSLLLGLGMFKGIAALRFAAIGMVGFLSIVFAWRSTVSWMAVAEGEPKVFAAVLISSMLAASILIVFRYVRTFLRSN